MDNKNYKIGVIVERLYEYGIRAENEQEAENVAVGLFLKGIKPTEEPEGMQLKIRPINLGRVE